MIQIKSALSMLIASQLLTGKTVTIDTGIHRHARIEGDDIEEIAPCADLDSAAKAIDDCVERIEEQVMTVHKETGRSFFFEGFESASPTHYRIYFGS